MDNQELMKLAIERLELCGGRMRIRRLAAELGIESRRDMNGLRTALMALEQEGGIVVEGERIATLAAMGYLWGRVQRKAEGNGFFISDDGAEDLYIPRADMNGAMNGDTVWAERLPHARAERGRARVVRVARRANRLVTGRFTEGAACFVRPDDPRVCADIFIPTGHTMGAADGDRVVAVLSAQDGEAPQGSITEVMGKDGDRGVDILSIIRRMELEDSFGSAALRQAAALAPPTERELAGREDLRGLLTITIDGADAKDLDDAVTLLRSEDGLYRLYVHIADVSHYVKPGSPIDIEAYRRGTSVYFPDRVLPMLPEELSNGLCSLNPNEDKLAVSCRMDIGARGGVRRCHIADTVIRSDYRMTYDEVNAIFMGDAETAARYAGAVDMLFEMRALMKRLSARRVSRGSIDFDLNETGIALDEKGFAVDVYAKQRGEAERLIEEFMLLANESVAAHCLRRGLPAMYRVHSEPSAERMEELGAFARSLGYRFDPGREVQPKDVQRLLDMTRGTPEESVISKVALRAMSKAGYDERCTGHFGLALERYCHFTSPIRRYPDLMVHRAVKAGMNRRLPKEYLEKQNALLPAAAEHCSARERLAIEAERAADNLKKCQYMTRHIGEEYEGVISGVKPRGFYVELPNTVEGLVRTAPLRRLFVFDEKRYTLSAENGGTRYRLGDSVRVRAAAADMQSMTVEFTLIGEEYADAGGYRMGYSAKRGKKKPGSSTNAKNNGKITTVHSRAKGGRGNGGKKRGKAPRRKPKGKA